MQLDLPIALAVLLDPELGRRDDFQNSLKPENSEDRWIDDFGREGIDGLSDRQYPPEFEQSPP